MLDELEWPGFKPGDPVYEYIKKSKRAQCRLGLQINEGELERTTAAANRLIRDLRGRQTGRASKRERLCDKTAKRCGMRRKAFDSGKIKMKPATGLMDIPGL